MALLTRRHEQQQKWDPFAELREMSDRLNRVFAPEPFAFLARRGEEQPLSGVDFSPQSNISETENAYLIKLDLPEVKKEDVKLSIENGLLSIEGERKQERKEENERFHRVESSYGRFLRRFALPDDADENAVEATYKDGALTVRLAKTPEKARKARQIKVS